MRKYFDIQVSGFMLRSLLTFFLQYLHALRGMRKPSRLIQKIRGTMSYF